MILTTRGIHVCALICLTYSIAASGQVPTKRDAWAVQRVTVAKNNVYAFGKWEGAAKAGPRFVKMGVATDGSSHDLRRYDLWGWWWTDCERIPMRWRVGAGTLYTGVHVDHGGPAQGQSATLVCWPLGVLIPGQRAMLVHATYQKVWDQTTRFSLGPVSGMAVGSIQLTENGYRTKGPGWYQVKNVYFDFRPLDAVRVELLVTRDGRPSLWEYDGTQNTEEWKNRPSMAGRTIIRDPDDPFLAQSGWHHKKNLPLSIDGPFLWMQNPQYVLAEREGVWCVIGPLDQPNTQVVNIVPKTPETPLVLVEDVHTGRNYFWYNDKLLDAAGRELHTVSPTATTFEDRFRDVVTHVVSLRPSP